MSRSVLRSRPLAQGQEVSTSEQDLLISVEETGGPLISPSGPFGPEIRCPVCETLRPFMQYTQLLIAEKYARYVLPVFRCPTPGCRHVFALNPNPEDYGEAREP